MVCLFFGLILIYVFLWLIYFFLIINMVFCDVTCFNIMY